MVFQWDQANEVHIAEHGVTRKEVEQVMTGDPVQIVAETRNGELRLTFVGPTAAGRILVVVITPRGESIRPVTAFPAKKKTRCAYLEFITGGIE